jgi:DNA polymerase-3 subunit beta
VWVEGGGTAGYTRAAMEFRIAADELKKALHRAQGIVERKATMPILSNVLITAGKAGVTVTAFDLDIGIVSEHAAEVMKTGAVTVSARTLLDIVSFVPDAQVTVKKLANNYAEITSGAAHYKIVGMAPEEFPKLPREDASNLVKISGPTLLEMIKKTSYAISNDETRYILNGVFFEPREGGKVRMVATDGHRLSLVERELLGDFKLKAGVIIPRKGLMELKRLLDEAPEADCQLGFAENSALFKKPGLSMVMRLIDGQFPEYQRVIPKEGEKQLMVSRARLGDALKRIALLSADKSNAVKVSLSENLLRITANNPDLGEAKDDLEVAYRGGSMTVGFNARYIQDVLASMDTDEVAVELGDEHSPGVMHAPGDRSYTTVVMPMRV